MEFYICRYGTIRFKDVPSFINTGNICVHGVTKLPIFLIHSRFEVAAYLIVVDVEVLVLRDILALCIASVR